MSIRNIVLASVLTAASAGVFAQAKEQFFPSLAYRTGAYAPNGVPFANGYADYMKLVNARGGINGIKTLVEECVPPTPRIAALSAMNGSRASTVVPPCSRRCPPASLLR